MKKKIVWQSNFPLLKTGLGKNTKYVLDYLVRTNKYDITLYAMGLNWENPSFAALPYKVYGCLPNNPQEIQQINSSDEGYKRHCAYGGFYIDRIIREIKPDIWVGSDDQWAFDGYTDKKWFNKINSIMHVTLDSVPIIPSAVEAAKKTKNYIVWSEFAEKEMCKLGLNHIKTIPGCIDENVFKRFDKSTRTQIRHKHDLPENAFIMGTDSRNQCRKEFPVLLEGFSMFLKQNPEVKNAYLFLITTYNEGWSLPRYIEEFNIPKDRFLALYLCKECREIQIRRLQGQDLDCKFCGTKKSQQTIRIDFGCSEEQLNEAYNVFDCICHLFNAAGLELVHIQALYSELPLASVNYAAGEVFCEQPFITTIENAWTRQLGTEFRRSIPYPSSVAKYIKKIYNMSEEKRSELGKKGREWAINKFSPKVVGKQWEDLFDSLPDVKWDYNFDYKVKNDKWPYESDKYTNDVDFIVSLYKNVLFLENETNSESPGIKNWLQVLANGGKREDIYKYFIKTARKDNAKNIPVDINSFFDDTGRKRALMIVKESAGDCFYVSALFESFHKQYENCDLYIMCDDKFKSIFEGNPNVYRILPYIPQLENELFCIGTGSWKGIIDYFFYPTLSTQIRLNYLSNSNPLSL